VGNEYLCTPRIHLEVVNCADSYFNYATDFGKWPGEQMPNHNKKYVWSYKQDVCVSCTNMYVSGNLGSHQDMLRSQKKCNDLFKLQPTFRRLCNPTEKPLDSLRQTFRLSVCLSACLSVCLSDCLSLCLPAWSHKKYRNPEGIFMKLDIGNFY
jgi:hypothetical protein